jgi:hypothetical protein
VRDSSYFGICPRHVSGDDCAYDCVDFACTKYIFVDGDAEQTLTHAKMYEMADKYDVVGLKQPYIDKYRRACVVYWDHPKFAESAYHVYCTTPTHDKGFRNIVCRTISQHIRLLKKPEVGDLKTEFNGLTFGLLFDEADQAGCASKSRTYEVHWNRNSLCNTSEPFFEKLLRA